jgi:DNA-binding MarR family transcriptional regulator
MGLRTLDDIRREEYRDAMQSLPVLNQAPLFSSIEEEAFLNLVQTADHLARRVEDLFRPTELSSTQFNVLRILRAAGEDGLQCGQICEQMISRDPDMTRLLDRLEKRGLILRSRDAHDRRVVRARITAAALSLLGKLDEPLAQLHRLQLKHMTPDQLRMLISLLEQARGESPALRTKPGRATR